MNMINYFTITYRLKELDPVTGNMKNFSPTQDLYFANILANSSEEAIDKLCDQFNMLTVEVVTVSDEKQMTENEYNAG